MLNQVTPTKCCADCNRNSLQYKPLLMLIGRHERADSRPTVIYFCCKLTLLTKEITRTSVKYLPFHLDRFLFLTSSQGQFSKHCTFYYWKLAKSSPTHTKSAELHNNHDRREMFNFFTDVRRIFFYVKVELTAIIRLSSEPFFSFSGWHVLKVIVDYENMWKLVGKGSDFMFIRVLIIVNMRLVISN